MKYLKKMTKTKNTCFEQGNFSRSFRTITTSQDYNIDIHKDIDDYGWSFLI